jgi:hypothetical protein
MAGGRGQLLSTASGKVKTMTITYLGLSVLWLINVAICVWLGIRKNRPLLGTILGVFITSLVGILIMLLIPPKEQEQWGVHNWNARAPN